VGQDQAREPDKTASLTLVDIAQEIIDGAFMEPYVKDPSVEEQQARVRFALKLDPGCADAFLIQGAIKQQEGQLEAAKTAYEQAMSLATLRLGEEAFSREARQANTPPFWAAGKTRGYMRARQGLAMVLWQQGHLKEAAMHFEALLKLNPTDNQGNIDLLIGCLRELGDEHLLQRAWKRYGKAYGLEHRFLLSDD
jgi:tetratricopeptide (TPR) repeat protein